jgi:hypothetical protein
MVKKFHADQVVDVVDRLGSLVVDLDKKESRDIYSIGLKTIIGAVADDQGEQLSLKLLRSLITGLKAPTGSGHAQQATSAWSATTPDKEKSSKAGDADFENILLDIVKDVFIRFGVAVAAAHEGVMAVIVPRLEHKEETVRKRASQTLGAMVGVCADAVFSSLMDTVIAKMENAAKANTPMFLYTYIQTIGVISQSAGTRVAPYLHKIVPILERFCAADNKLGFEDADKLLELWEHCLQVCTVQQCSAQISGLKPYFLTFLCSFPMLFTLSLCVCVCRRSMR